MEEALIKRVLPHSLEAEQSNRLHADGPGGCDRGVRDYNRQ